MQYLHKIKSFAVGTVGVACLAGSVLYSGVASAFPFKPNPQSFQNYLNSIKWNDGIKREYSNFANCDFNQLSNTEFARCSGYRKTYSPQGVEVCSVVQLLTNYLSPSNIIHKTHTKSCRWL